MWYFYGLKGGNGKNTICYNYSHVQIVVKRKLNFEKVYLLIFPFSWLTIQMIDYIK